MLVLGGPNSGKTHYAGQLFGRLLRRPTGRLRIPPDATPADLSLLDEVLACLEDGRAASHTHSDTHAQLVLHLLDQPTGRRLDITWPDYGGEQLQAVFNTRSVTQAWAARLRAANGWLLFIRLGIEPRYEIRLEHALDGAGAEAIATRQANWDPNARWVEVLQILLHVARHGTYSRRQHPRLAVMLSCYDEDPTPMSPRERLATQLPMLAAFLDASWDPAALSVWGLSSLGRPLTEESRDPNFINHGPEYQGWVIGPEGGAPNSDLTAPVAWLLGLR